MLKGKRAFIAGAGTDGIGRRIALELAREGADICIQHQNQTTDMQAFLEDIRQTGHKCTLVEAELGSPRSGRDLIAKAIDALGRIDVFVWSIGVTTRVPFLDLSEEDWSHVQTVNLWALFGALQECARHMIDNEIKGRIIVVSSVNQDRVLVANAHYCAAKGGVKQLTRTAALELAEHGITANLIAPGTVRTDFNRKILEDPDELRARVDLIPMNRIGDPEDIAGAAVFLAGEAGAYITGTTITADGGMSLR